MTIFLYQIFLFKIICNKMTCNKIDITKYVKKFDVYPNDVLEFMTKNNQRLPALTSLVG